MEPLTPGTYAGRDALPNPGTYADRVLTLVAGHAGRTGMSLVALERAWTTLFPDVTCRRGFLRRALRRMRGDGVLGFHHRHVRSYVCPYRVKVHVKKRTGTSELSSSHKPSRTPRKPSRTSKGRSKSRVTKTKTKRSTSKRSKRSSSRAAPAKKTKSAKSGKRRSAGGETRATATKPRRAARAGASKRTAAAGAGAPPPPPPVAAGVAVVGEAGDNPNLPGGSALAAAPPVLPGALPAGVQGGVVVDTDGDGSAYHAQFVRLPNGDGGAPYDVEITLQLVECSDDITRVVQREGIAGTAGIVTIRGAGPMAGAKAAFEDAFREHTGFAWQNRHGAPFQPGKAMFVPAAAYTQCGRGQWEYYIGIPVDGKGRGWYPFVPAASALVERMFGEWEHQRAVARPDRAFAQRHVQSGRWMYRLDFEKMQQMNTQHVNHTVRSVRRVAMAVPVPAPAAAAGN